MMNLSRTELREFLEIPYEKLEELNLQSKAYQEQWVPMDQVEAERREYLAKEKRIKAVTVAFSDLEGRLHMLDYDKKYLLGADQLTFDGSSIRGFTRIAESDLRLGIDWRAFYWMPADVFGPGKVLVFGHVLDRDHQPYASDFRSRLHALHRGSAPQAGPGGQRLGRDRGLPLRQPRRRARVSRERAASTSSPPAATTTACPRIPCASSSTPRPRCSGPWASRTRRTTPRWAPPSSR